MSEPDRCEDFGAEATAGSPVQQRLALEGHHPYHQPVGKAGRVIRVVGYTVWLLFSLMMLFGAIVLSNPWR